MLAVFGVIFVVEIEQKQAIYTSLLIKGIVHPKIIIYSSSSSSKPVWMCLFCWTQRKIFWRMRETEQVWGTVDLHSIFLSSMEVNNAPNSLITNFLQNIFLCVLQNKHSYKYTKKLLNYSNAGKCNSLLSISGHFKKMWFTWSWHGRVFCCPSYWPITAHDPTGHSS